MITPSKLLSHILQECKTTARWIHVYGSEVRTIWDAEKNTQIAKEIKCFRISAGYRRMGKGRNVDVYVELKEQQFG